MSNLALPRRQIWTRQPPRAVDIDWAAPITAGLISAILPSAKLFAGTRPSSGGFTATNSLVTEHGIALGRNGAGWSLPQRPIFGIPVTSDMTLLAFLYGDSTVLTETTPVTTGQNAGAVSSSISVGDGTTKALRYKIYLGATRYVGGSFVIPAKPTVVVGRQRYGVEQALFVGGEKDPVTGSYTGASNGVTHFGSYSGNASTRVLLSAIWARALSDEEIHSLSDNPWQIFAPRETRIFVPVSAGGAGYTLDAQPASVAVTGASATLKSSRTLSADAGSVTIAGANADLVYTPVGASPVLNADPGSLTIVGAPATLKATRKLAADAGSITISGAAATLVKSTAGLTLNAQPGSVTIAGAAAEYRRTYKLEASSAGITIVGASAQLVYAGATGPTTRAPDGAGPSIIRAGTIRPQQSATSRPSNTGGRRH